MTEARRFRKRILAKTGSARTVMTEGLKRLWFLSARRAKHKAINRRNYSRPETKEKSMSEPVSAAQALAEQRDRSRALAKAIPEAMTAFVQLGKAAKTPRALGEKEKEFIALGIALAVGCEDCIVFHLDALKKLAARREEIADVLAMAVQMGGGPALMYAGRALALWDEMTKA